MTVAMRIGATGTVTAGCIVVEAMVDTTAQVTGMDVFIISRSRFEMLQRMVDDMIKYGEKIELPNGIFSGDCFNCKYADWSRRDEIGRVLCTAKQGFYENPKERKGCFNFEGIQSVVQKKIKEENLENTSSQMGKIIGSIAGILSIWVVFLFYQTANRMYESNMDAFWWLNKDAESLGRMMHWGIPLIVLLTCVANLWSFSGQNIRVNIF